MADTKISDLTELTTPDTTDEFAVVDTTAVETKRITWPNLEGAIDHTNITNIGTNSHTDIDTHIASNAIHFTQDSIDHTAITNIGTNSHAQIDTHISATNNPHSTTFSNLGGNPSDVITAGTNLTWDGDTLNASGGAGGGTLTTIKEGGVGVGDADIVYLDFDGNDFNLTESPDTEVNVAINDAGIDHDSLTNTHNLTTDIDHTSIQNIGTNTHAQIDTHIASSAIHFTEDSIDHTAITNIGTNSHTQIDTHIASNAIHFTEDSIDHTAITNIGTNSHSDIDTHIASNAIHFDIANTMGVVNHGASAVVSRALSYSIVTWIGSVEPTFANNNDVWIDTS